MSTSNFLIESINKNITNREEKEKIAKKILEKVKDGDIISAGSGSTSWLAVNLIAQKVKEEGIHIKMIPTSYEIKTLCDYLEIPTTRIDLEKPNWGFDGADEVSPEKWIIKGRGGALFKEKINMLNSPITYILIDSTKKVQVLGEKFKVPVECAVDAVNYVTEELQKIGGKEIELRKAVSKDGPVITENGNMILDVKFENISKELEKKIKMITGVIESGLFIDYPVEIIF